MSAVEIVNLTKDYGRGARALDGVSLTLEEGDAVALIGPNGAGKTTLLRILATLLKPTAGFARVFGHDGRFQASRIRPLLGYMPDAFGMYEDLTVEEYLTFFAAVYRLRGPEAGARVRDLISLLDLGLLRGRYVGTLSRGMQQRLGLGRILVHYPKLLLLDEPASNLDPRARIEIRELLRELRAMGKTILISSHILMELDRLCDKLVLMDRGKVLFAGAVAEVASRIHRGRVVAVRVAGEAAGFREALAAAPGVAQVAESDGWLRVRLGDAATDFSFIVRMAVERGLLVQGLKEEEPGLEDIFMNLTAEDRKA